ncbi:MAG: GNAT family N-acetyltransferase [Devosia sp.]
MLELVACDDSDFAWMLGTGASRLDLVLPPGGVDDRHTLEIIRGMHADIVRVHDRGTWMIVRNGEVVGLCGYKHSPFGGEVEIGFGVAVARRRNGYASGAIAGLVKEANDDPLVDLLVARTAIENFASQRALHRNGFGKVGTEFDPGEGELIRWSRVVSD